MFGWFLLRFFASQLPLKHTHSNLQHFYILTLFGKIAHESIFAGHTLQEKIYKWWNDPSSPGKNHTVSLQEVTHHFPSSSISYFPLVVTVLCCLNIIAVLISSIFSISFHSYVINQGHQCTIYYYNYIYIFNVILQPRFKPTRCDFLIFKAWILDGTSL